MTDLTFVHGNAAQRSAPPIVQAGKGVTSRSESQIETELMQQARVRADGGQASEARRWKEEHDKMAQVASELAYKTTASAQALQESQSRHKNLQDNHQAMQSKYRSIKEELAALRSTVSSSASLESDWRQKASKWKSNCTDLAARFEEHERTACASVHSLTGQLASARSALSQAVDKHAAALRAARSEASVLREQLETQASQHEQEKEGLLEELVEAEMRGDDLEEELQTQTALAAREAKRLKSALDATEEPLQELKGLKRDMPAVKERLKEAQRLATEKQRLATRLGTSEEENARMSQDCKRAVDSTKTELDSTRAELDAAKLKLKAAARAGAELDSTKAELDAAKLKLRAATQSNAELNALKQEIPVVKNKIIEGRLASQEAAELRRELAETKEQLKLAASPSKTSGAPALAITQEKLRAATQTIANQEISMTSLHKEMDRLQSSTKLLSRQQSDAMKACTSMLAHTEEVLRACTELHSKKGSPLSEALTETTNKVAKFLQTLAAAPP